MGEALKRMGGGNTPLKVGDGGTLSLGGERNKGITAMMKRVL